MCPEPTNDVDVFKYRRAKAIAQELEPLAEQLSALALQLDALLGADFHIPPRVLAVRAAVASLQAEVDQVVRDAAS